jgi:hypothetical protein
MAITLTAFFQHMVPCPKELAIRVFDVPKLARRVLTYLLHAAESFLRR